jgi:hypothetical protein
MTEKQQVPYTSTSDVLNSLGFTTIRDTRDFQKERIFVQMVRGEEMIEWSFPMKKAVLIVQAPAGVEPNVANVTYDVLMNIQTPLPTGAAAQEIPLSGEDTPAKNESSQQRSETPKRKK